MKANIYITVEGMEAVALGKTLFSWHFSTIPLAPDTDKETYGPGEGAVCILHGVSLQLPAAADCVAAVKAKLEGKLQEVRATAYREEQEIQTRINDLLMVGFNGESK